MTTDDVASRLVAAAGAVAAAGGALDPAKGWFAVRATVGVAGRETVRLPRDPASARPVCFSPRPVGPRWYDREACEWVAGASLEFRCRPGVLWSTGLDDAAGLRLARSGRLDDRRTLAGNRWLPDVAMEVLSRSRSEAVRFALAWNDGLPSDLADEWLARERSTKVAEVLLRNRRVSDPGLVLRRGDAHRLLPAALKRSDLTVETMVAARDLIGCCALGPDLERAWLCSPSLRGGLLAATVADVRDGRLLDLLGNVEFDGALLESSLGLLGRAVPSELLVSLGRRTSMSVRSFRLLGETLPSRARAALVGWEFASDEQLDLLPAGEVVRLRVFPPRSFPALTLEQLLVFAQLCDRFAGGVSALAQVALRA